MHGTCGFYHWFPPIFTHLWFRRSWSCWIFSLSCYRPSRDITTPHKPARYSSLGLNKQQLKDCLKHDLFSLSFKYTILPKLQLINSFKNKFDISKSRTTQPENKTKITFLKTPANTSCRMLVEILYSKLDIPWKWRNTDKSNTAAWEPHNIVRFHVIFCKDY